MALLLEKDIPSGHPALAKIQSLRSQLLMALKQHRENVGKIVQAGGDACRQALEKVDTACQDPEVASASVLFPVSTIDDQF